MSLFSLNWWKNTFSSSKVKKLPYPLSNDMRRNYDVIEIKMIQAMKGSEPLCIVYVPYLNSTTDDLIHLNLNLEYYDAKRKYPKTIENIALEIPDTLSNQSIITIIIQW